MVSYFTTLLALSVPNGTHRTVSYMIFKKGVMLQIVESDLLRISATLRAPYYTFPQISLPEYDNKLLNTAFRFLLP